MVSEGSSTHPLQGLDVFCGPGLVLQTMLYVHDRSTEAARNGLPLVSAERGAYPSKPSVDLPN